MAGSKEAAEFYDGIIEREKDIKEIKDEIKQAIESFASSNNVSTAGVEIAIADRKKYLKDRAAFLVATRDADQVFELFNYDPNGNLFEQEG